MPRLHDADSYIFMQRWPFTYFLSSGQDAIHKYFTHLYVLCRLQLYLHILTIKTCKPYSRKLHCQWRRMFRNPSAEHLCITVCRQFSAAPDCIFFNSKRWSLPPTRRWLHCHLSTVCHFMSVPTKSECHEFFHLRLSLCNFSLTFQNSLQHDPILLWIYAHNRNDFHIQSVSELNTRIWSSLGGEGKHSALYCYAKIKLY